MASKKAPHLQNDSLHFDEDFSAQYHTFKSAISASLSVSDLNQQGVLVKEATASLSEKELHNLRLYYNLRNAVIKANNQVLPPS